MRPATFEGFREIAQGAAGIHLREGKAALVQARLARRLRELGLSDEQDYLDALRGDRAELTRFLDAISTNFTRFFREPLHFEVVGRAVRAARAAGQRRFRFWCAGCASGEEPYTLAMTLEPLLAGADWRILATDLSTRALDRAAAATYADEEIAPVSRALRERYLEPAPAAGDGPPSWRVVAELRSRVVLDRLNLADRPYPMRGPLDAVFCRNVMIYFDRETRCGLVAEIERLLRPGAPLFIGHSETLNGIPTSLRVERPSVYRLVAAP